MILLRSTITVFSSFPACLRYVFLNILEKMKLENAVLNVSNLTRHRESATSLRFLLVEIVQLRLGLLIRTYVGRSVFRGSWRFVTSVSTGALTRFSPRQWFLPVLLLSRYSLKRCVKSAPLWNNFDFFPSSLTEDYAPRRVENCQASRTRKWRFERGVLKIFPILFSILETKESSTFHTVHLKNYLQLESISNSRIIANPTIFRRSIY